jgi:hypothetical protein
MSNIGPTFIAVVTGVIGLAIVAVLVAQKAQTSTVIQVTGTALSNIIAAAVGPVTGSTNNQFGSGGSTTG